MIPCNTCGRHFDGDAYPRHFVASEGWRCMTFFELSDRMQRDSAGIWHRQRGRLFRRPRPTPRTTWGTPRRAMYGPVRTVGTLTLIPGGRNVPSVHSESVAPGKGPRPGAA